MSPARLSFSRAATAAGPPPNDEKEMNNMAIREVDATDLKKGDVLEDGTRVLDAYDVGDEDGLLARGRWIEFSDGNTGMIMRGEARYRIRS